jgi:hypothetical protein
MVEKCKFLITSLFRDFSVLTMSDFDADTYIAPRAKNVLVAAKTKLLSFDTVKAFVLFILMGCQNVDE